MPRTRQPSLAERCQSRGSVCFCLFIFFKLKYAFVVQLLSHVQLFGIPRTGAHQVSLSFTISWSLFRFMSIEFLMPFNHLILCSPFSSRPQSFPASGSFPMSWLFESGSQRIEASAWMPCIPLPEPHGPKGIIGNEGPRTFV